MAVELHIKLDMTLLNQLQKLSSQLYNYLQTIKSFVVKISTHRKCCELIIPQVPGMGDKKVSIENYLRSMIIFQKKLYCPVAAYLPIMQ